MKILAHVVMMIMMLLAFGCGPSPIKLSSTFGQSATMAKQGQILNPEAGMNLAPVEGLDGPAAQNNVDTYRKSFEPSGEKDSSIGMLLSPLKK